MHDAKKSAADLSAQERLCLLLIGDGGLEAFNPREDEVLASLLDMELIDSHGIDDETALMRLTEDGHVMVARLRDNMG
jgi:hypothetical protein